MLHARKDGKQQMDTTLGTTYRDSFAVCIGINAYRHLRRLQGAVNDASSVANVLIDEFGFDGERVFTLLDEEATERSVKKHLELVSKEAHLNDRVVFFFAGHGVTRKNVLGGDIGYVAVVESETDDWSSYLRIEDITWFSELIAAKHVFYVFDSCFSGLAFTRKPISGIGEKPVARWIADSMTHRTRQVLTAGLAEQEVGDLTQDGHSIFTSYFLRALSGEAAGSEGEITASQVMAYVTDKVMKDPSSQQTPAYGDLSSEPGGDFVFRYPGLSPFAVPADQEGGINTQIPLQPGQQVTFKASGVITYDSGFHFANPDGWLCSYKGQPLAHPEAFMTMVIQHEEAYRTDGGRLGILGSLIGWIGEYSEKSTFLIGSAKEIIADREGLLYLAINDVKGTYADNQGEYEVTIKVV